MDNAVVAQTRFLSKEMLELLNDSWLAMANWKWLVLVGVFVVVLALRPLLQALFKHIKRVPGWIKESDSFLAQILSLPLENPLSWIVACLIWIAAIDALALPANLDKYLGLFAKILLTIHLIRLAYDFVEALGMKLQRLAAKTETTLDDQLAPFITKTLKVLTVLLGVLMALQNFGVNVVGLLAGLGIGGLALAFAAQDTAANVFGSVMILADQPFQLGDFVKVADVEGTVEEIGFRSTRIRTFYNSIVTIPNSVVAREKIDNMQVRPRRRVRQVLGVAYETSPSQMEAFVDEVRAELLRDPKVDKDVIVAFNNFGASTLDVLVQFHLLGAYDGVAENAAIQGMLLKFLAIAERLGVEFAYPTQTLHVRSLPPTGATNEAGPPAERPV